MIFETLITILTIENLNSWQSLLSENWLWHWTAFAILAMFSSLVRALTHVLQHPSFLQFTFNIYNWPFVGKCTSQPQRLKNLLIHAAQIFSLLGGHRPCDTGLHLIFSIKLAILLWNFAHTYVYMKQIYFSELTGL